MYATFSLFPLKRDRVMFISFLGKRFSCNTKHVFLYLQKHYPGEFKYVWTFEDPGRYKELKGKDVILCKFRRLRYFYFISTSGVVVTNVGAEIYGRKGQFVVNTWHGGGSYKTVARYNKTISNFDEDAGIKCYPKASLILSSSKVFTDDTLRKSMAYTGEVLACGMPRNDLLLDRQSAQRTAGALQKKLNIADDTNIVLYAPTWRENMTVANYGLDFQQMKNALKTRFGGEWLVCVRYHHNSTIGAKQVDGVLDLTSYPDMQELLCLADVLVTDYSSSIWDFSFTGKPCFLYCTDLEEYKQERDFYRPIATWGFPVCRDNAELGAAILAYDEDVHKKNMARHHEELGSYESGRATEAVCERIYAACFGEKPTGGRA